MHTALRRGMCLSILVASAACSGRAAKDDPNKPAVVTLPPVVLVSDTAKPDTTLRHNNHVDYIKRTLDVNRAVLQAAIVNRDMRMIVAQYAPDATLNSGDTAVSGAQPIALYWARQADAMSVKSYNQKSAGWSEADSVVTDSGTYTISSNRTVSASNVGHGTYVTKWRMHPEPLNWVIKADKLVEAKPKK